MNEIYFGQITMAHGLKGELKLYTDFECKDTVLKKGFPVYINHQKHILSSVKSYKNHYLITLDNLFDINLVEPFRHQKVYVKKEDLHVEYLMSDLIDFQVIEKQEVLGIIRDIMYNKGGIYLKVELKGFYYIPWQDAFVEQVDLLKKCVYVKNVKGLML